MASSIGNRLALANRLPVTASNHKLDDDSTPIHANYRIGGELFLCGLL